MAKGDSEAVAWRRSYVKCSQEKGKWGGISCLDKEVGTTEERVGTKKTSI